MATPKRVLLLLSFFVVGLSCLLGQEENEDDSESGPTDVQHMIATAEALRKEGKYNEGFDLALKALDYSLQSDNPTLIARAHYQTAIFHNFKGEFDQARAHLELGLDQARSSKQEDLEADLLVAEGIVEWKLGNLNLATHHLEEAMKIRVRTGDHLSLANIANNLGIIQFSLKQYEESITYYREGLDWLGDQDSNRLRASLYTNLAESLIPVGEFDDAENYLLKSLEIEKKNNQPQSMAYIYLILAKLRSTQMRRDEAIKLFQKTIDLQLSTGETWAAAMTRIDLASEYLENEDTDQALEVLGPGFESIKRLNALSLLRDYAALYARIYSVRDEPGLETYYQDLGDWFTDRIKGPIDMDSRHQVIASKNNEAFFNSPSRQVAFKWLRMAILLVLILLIIYLTIDNVRLRMDQAKSPQKDEMN